GSWQGTLRARSARARDRHEGVLRRPPLALAETDEREHERVVASVLPEGHGPLTLVRRGPRSSRARAQQPATQKPRLDDTDRSVRGAATLTSTTRCCNDRLNSGSSRRFAT